MREKKFGRKQWVETTIKKKKTIKSEGKLERI